MAAIAKGMITQALLNCALTAVLGEAATTVLKIIGIAQDAGAFVEAVKSGKPDKIIVESLRLVVSLFTLKCQCFTADTLVSTADGDRRIDEIKSGDYVWSYNDKNGEKVLAKVTDVSVTETDILVHVITSDGGDIEITMFHPFYVKDKCEKLKEGHREKWKAALNLKTGDVLQNKDEEIVYVYEVFIERLNEPVKVYNLQIDVLHTYFIGNGILVHNACIKNSDGTYTIDDWSDYPDELVHPEGPFNVLEGDEYTAARKAANDINRRLHRYISELKVHEVLPVKFGGSPTDIDNKIALKPEVHRKFTFFWNMILREIKEMNKNE